MSAHLFGHGNPDLETGKLQKIIQVLMDQVERGIDYQGHAYSLFQTAVVLEDKVRQRTETLETAFHELEDANRQLSIAKAQTDAAQTRLMEAVESISEGFIHFDRDDRLVLCNTKFLELWPGIADVAVPGASRKDLARWTLDSGLVVDADGQFCKWLRSRLHRRRKPRTSIVVALKTRQWLQIRERSTEDGGSVGIYTDISDIKLSETKRREQELREKSVLLQATLDNLAQGVSVFDKHLRLVAWNDRFKDLLDLPDNLVRQNVSFDEYLRFRALRGDYGEKGNDAVEARLEAVQNHISYQTEQVLTNGRVLEISRRPMPGGGFVTTYTDVTDRNEAADQLRDAKVHLERRVHARTAELSELNAQLRQEILERTRAEEAIRIAKAQAEEANISKTRFLAAASHDLLQPLNAARLFVTALSERNLSDKEGEIVAQIDGALKSVEGLLGALLDISRLDAGGIAVNAVDFSIDDLLHVLRHEYEPMAREAGLGLRVLPCHAVVRSDPGLLGRVLRNLLSNAIRYTPSGRVLLGCRWRNGRLRIEVCDTGVGIPEHHLGEIFEEFRQLGAPSHFQEKNFGLGLAIVQRIARTLDHPIEVTSTLGKGSNFRIEVPISSQPPQVEPRDSGYLDFDDAVAGSFVAVIENEETVLSGMRELLVGWGCEVVTANCASTGRHRFCETGRVPDLVIADFHIGDGPNGVEFIESIRGAHNHPTPAIIITADRSDGVMKLVQDRGLHLLQKPVKPAKLRALMSHLLI
ncbi:MAG: PAS-domain containing protein [Rhodospirillales bacterium]|nr:PAS-domain containing protein [Rhodospirillales bacterium]